jgi:hypothetical protein
LPRIGGVARGSDGRHRGREPAGVGHHRAGISRHHALAHEREIALCTVWVPREELDGHDLPEYRVAEELEPLVRTQMVGSPLRMQQGLPPKVRIEQLEQLGEITGWVSGVPRNRSGR